jgi:hypothetical protein
MITDKDGFMHYTGTQNREINPRLLLGAVVYGIVCGSGVGAAVAVGLFAVTSFIAFIYLLLNRSPRSLGMILLSLIPVIGAVIALELLFQRAWKQIIAGLFFYVFPLFFMVAPIGSRLFGVLLGGLLFYAFFNYVPGVRNNPGATFMFMWALPTVFFFIIAAIFMPFIGRAADVDAGGFDAGDHDFGGSAGASTHDYSSFDHGYAAHDQGFEGDYSSSGDVTFQHPDSGLIGQDHDFSGDHGFQPESPHFGNDFSHDTGVGGHDQFDLTSYPHQGLSQPTWLESHFDPNSGRLSVEGSHGSFDLFSPSQGEFVGYNGDGQMIHFSHNPETHSVTMMGPDGPKFLLQDQGTGTWSHIDSNGMTIIKSDPVTGWTHVRGPGSEMTIKFNPFNNTATGTGTVTN